MKKLINVLQRHRSRVLVLLIVISILMTSSTFAYWTDSVVGNEISTSSVITIGTYELSNPLFTLSSTSDSGEYSITSNNVFTNNQGYTHSFVETFEAEWLYSSSWVDSYVIEGDIEFDYEILLVKSNGNTVGSKKYNRLIPYIDFSFNDDNDSSIIINEDAKTFGFTLNITEPTKSSHYSQLEDLTVSVLISYTVDNITYEYIYSN